MEFGKKLDKSTPEVDCSVTVGTVVVREDTETKSVAVEEVLFPVDLVGVAGVTDEFEIEP